MIKCLFCRQEMDYTNFILRHRCNRCGAEADEMIAATNILLEKLGDLIASIRLQAEDWWYEESPDTVDPGIDEIADDIALAIKESFPRKEE